MKMMVLGVFLLFLGILRGIYDEGVFLLFCLAKKVTKKAPENQYPAWFSEKRPDWAAVQSGELLFEFHAQEFFIFLLKIITRFV